MGSAAAAGAGRPRLNRRAASGNALRRLCVGAAVGMGRCWAALSLSDGSEPAWDLPLVIAIGVAEAPLESTLLAWDCEIVRDSPQENRYEHDNGAAVKERPAEPHRQAGG